MEHQKQADRIREFVGAEIISPARRRGELSVRIVSGEVLKRLGLRNNQAPAVCGALKARKFQQENRVNLERLEGPPKKQSTRVTFTFRLLDSSGAAPSGAESRLLGLWGIGKEVFASLGGGENFIRSEREQFSKADHKQ